MTLSFQFHKYLVLLFSCFTLVSCKKETTTVPLKKSFAYAKGFSIETEGSNSKITIFNPYKNAAKNYQFLLVPKGDKIPPHDSKTQIIRTPVEKIIATSTTHIPLLELLEVTHTLVGFPNTDFVSSIKTRERIDNGSIKDVGRESSLNTELVLALQPEVLVGFSVDKPNKSLLNIQKSGIPVLLNGDWLEASPLGRAEWIRLFGALYQKEAKADSIFKEIESNYIKAKAIAAKSKNTPSVFSGAMYQDVWYLPAGESFMATYFKDANTNYIWRDTRGTGSLSLSFENVLVKAQKADVWIGCSLFEDKKGLLQASEHYAQFEAFQDNTHTFANLKGAKGGLFYFEMGPIRPDLILKDIVKIAHPDLLPDYQPFFFKKLH